MNFTRFRFFPLSTGIIALGALAGAGLMSPAWAQDDTKRPGPPAVGPRFGSPGGGPPPAPDADLTEEERQILRRVLGKVWSDESVVLARDEVKRATDRYRKAVEEAMASEDPRALEIMGKLNDDDDDGAAPGGGAPDRRGGGPGFPPGSDGSSASPRPGGGPGTESSRTGSGGFTRRWDQDIFLRSATMAMPSFYAKLSEEDKEIYRKAHAEALESEVGQEVVENVKALIRQEDEDRRERMEKTRDLYSKSREKMRAAIIAADPRVKAWFDKRDAERAASKSNHARKGDDGKKGPEVGARPPAER